MHTQPPVSMATPISRQQGKAKQWEVFLSMRIIRNNRQRDKEIVQLRQDGLQVLAMVVANAEGVLCAQLLIFMRRLGRYPTGMLAF